MHRYILLFFIACSLHLSAQQGDVYDTAKRMDPYSTSLYGLHRNQGFDTPTDSSMVFFSQYNPIKRNEMGIQDLGDAFTPYRNQLYSTQVMSGFQTGFNPYGQYYFYNDKARFYDAKLPFTSFYYTQGKAGQPGRSLISFDAMHTQNIGERFNIGVNYHSTTNHGYYLNNTNAMKNLQVSTFYKAKNNRYLASMLFTWNKTNFKENGGIEMSKQADSLFRNPNSTVRYVSVELNNASNINRYREHQLKQTYWLKMSEGTDLSPGVPQLGISHQLYWNKQANYYRDQTADFNYPLYDSVYFFNSTYTSDSMGFTNVGNCIEVFTPLGKKGLNFLVGIQAEQFVYFQSANKGNYQKLSSNNNSVYGQLGFSFLSLFQSVVNGRFYLSGYNATDHQLSWKNEAILIKTTGIKLNANISSSAIHPAYQQQRMLSNHFVWNNNFNQMLQQSAEFGLSGKMNAKGVYNAFVYTLPKEAWSLKASYALLTNYIYYNSEGAPQQLSTSENILQLRAMKHLNLKKFQWHQEIGYQLFSKALESKILLPAFVSKTSIYFQNYVFKKATFIQAGADIYYSSSYKAGIYNPATRNFQVSDISVGNYPFFDLFINAEIKTARAFFRMEHFNQDMFLSSSQPNYFYTSPYQPSALRRFRLGLAWKFYY